MPSRSGKIIVRNGGYFSRASGSDPFKSYDFTSTIEPVIFESVVVKVSFARHSLGYARAASPLGRAASCIRRSEDAP